MAVYVEEYTSDCILETICRYRIGGIHIDASISPQVVSCPQTYGGLRL